MIRTQISVDEDLYRDAKDLAARQGVSLAELVRHSLRETLDREPKGRPWLKFSGIVDGNTNDSESVDDVVYRQDSA